MKKTLIFLLFINLYAVQTQPIDHGTVVVVYDGDTIKVRFDSGVERKVRLIGIDTAEIEDTPFATRLEALLAKRFTFFHLYRKRIKLTYERELEDRFGRLLAYVWDENGLFNQFILEQGFSRVFLKFSYALKDTFIHAQKEAQDRGRGFWHDKPYPAINVRQVKKHIGKLTRVRFVCTRIRKSGRLLFLQTKTGNFAAVIQNQYLSSFGNIQKMKGKSLEVFGFLEEYRGQPQIMLFFSSQINNSVPVPELFPNY